VPIKMRVQATGSAPAIAHIYLIVDHNPSPVGVVFHAMQKLSWVEIETRIRIESYTPLRVIAEYSDGTLGISNRYIKASGGCSAPAGSNNTVAEANLGKIKLRSDGLAASGATQRLQLMVSHPNNSGLVRDPVTLLNESPRFVRQILIRFDEKPWLAVDTDFTLSENPYLAVTWIPGGPGAYDVEVNDTRERHFVAHLDG